MNSCSLRGTISVVGSLLLGCYYSYTGIYFLPSGVDDQRAFEQKVIEATESAITPFGFSPKILGSREMSGSWHNRDGRIDARYSALKGADAYVSVAVDCCPVGIAIRDLSYNAETEFVRALKASIERSLRENLGVKDVPFQRQCDFPFV